MGSSGAARAVLAGGAVASAAALLAIWRSFGAGISPWLALRLAGCGAATLAVAQWSAPPGAAGALAKLVALTVTFVLSAGLTRVVTLDELRRLRNPG